LQPVDDHLKGECSVTTNKVHVRMAFSLLALLLSVTSQSKASSLSFVEVANTTTSIPGGSGTFTGFGLPAINGNYVAFDAPGSNSLQGIYVWSQAGGLQRVTDNNGTGFSSFNSPAVDSNGTAAFQGGSSGIYTGVGGGSSVTTVASASSTVPGNPGGSFFFSPLDSRPASIDNGVVAFEAWSRSGGSVNQGIYTGPSSGGALSLVADRSTFLPFGTSFTQMIFFNGPAINNGQVLFNATTGSITQESGVYALINGSIVRVIDSTQTLPGTSVQFSLSEGQGITPGAIAGGRVAFWSNEGYYGMNTNGTLTPLATTTNTPPGSSQPFLGTFGLGLNANGSYLFTGVTAGASGYAIYYSPSFTSGDYIRLIGDGDQLDGKTISSIQTFPYSLSGNDFVMEVNFTDGSQAIYEGIIGAQSVPEPSSVVLLAAGAAAALAYRCRARRAQ
jgi:PEP-CTERM motif